MGIMSKTSEHSTVVELHGANAAVHFPEGCKIDVPVDLLDRSSVLRQALSSVDSKEKVPLFVPQDFLQSWLQWRTNESSWDSSFLDDAPQIVLFLQVRDSSSSLDVRWLCCPTVLYS